MPFGQGSHLPCPNRTVIRQDELLELVTFMLWRRKYLQVLRGVLSGQVLLTRPHLIVARPSVSIPLQGIPGMKLRCLLSKKLSFLVKSSLHQNHLRKQVWPTSLSPKYLSHKGFYGQPLFFLKRDLDKGLWGCKKHKPIQTNFSEKRGSDAKYIFQGTQGQERGSFKSWTS